MASLLIVAGRSLSAGIFPVSPDSSIADIDSVRSYSALVNNRKHKYLHYLYNGTVPEEGTATPAEFSRRGVDFLGGSVRIGCRQDETRRLFDNAVKESIPPQ